MTEETKELIRENVRQFKRIDSERLKTIDHKLKDRNILIRELRSQGQILFDILTDGTDNKQIPVETLLFWLKQRKNK